MDDTFRLRAEKAFGSLASSTSPWSVAGHEVERREWRRGKDASDRDQTPCSSSFLEEEWGIKASIGMDPTLDYEEEEDEYDKVAEGTEGVGDRLYMDQVSRHGSYLNSHNVLHGGRKDRRANFLASKLRLKEDDAEAQNLDSTPAASASASQVKEQVLKSSEDGGRPKSILKRKGHTAAVKAQKRVRFDPSCLTHCDSEETSDTVEDFDMDSSNVNRMVSDRCSVLASRSRTAKVPDYLVNPSKYTHYSFDTTDSNARACMDYLSQANGSNSESTSEMEDALVQLPKSVTFVPKKKTGDGNAVGDRNNTKQDKKDDSKRSLNQASFPVSIAAVEVQSEVSAAEEEGSEPNAVESSARLKKPGRKYRSKSVSDESDS